MAQPICPGDPTKLWKKPQKYSCTGDLNQCNVDSTLKAFFAEVGAGQDNYFRCLTSDSNNNIFGGGHAKGNPSFATDCPHSNCMIGMISKFDDTGAEQWTVDLGPTPAQGVHTYVRDMEVDASDDLFAVGKVLGDWNGASLGDYDYFIVKLDTAGVTQWVVQGGSTETDEAYQIKIDSSGDLVVGGHSNGDLFGGTADNGVVTVFLMKLAAADGSLVWGEMINLDVDTCWATTTYNAGSVLYGMVLTSSGNAMLVGYTQGAYSGASRTSNLCGKDFFVMARESSVAGGPLWAFQGGSSYRKYAGTNIKSDEIAFAVDVDSSDDAYVFGNVDGYDFMGLGNDVTKNDTPDKAPGCQKLRDF